MKAILEFDLSSEDDKYEFKGATKGKYLFLAISDFNEELRAKIKYEDSVGSFNEARDLLWECLKDRGIGYDDID